MSASIATPMASLADFDFSPDEMPDFRATEYSDVMKLDRSTDMHEHYNHPHPTTLEPREEQTSHAQSNATSHDLQKEALGNLLGALMSNQNASDADAPMVDPTTNETTTIPDQYNLTEHAHPHDEANPPVSRLPSFDETAAANLFSAEDYSHPDQSMNPPQTPVGQTMGFHGGAHFRQDSLASQQSVSQRPATPQQREFAAFARLQFEDGSYYLNTYSCELGRDVLAYRAALQREREEKEATLNRRHGNTQSSSGGASGNRRRQRGSQIQGSVVSEQGGFAGIDDPPVRQSSSHEKQNPSSHESESSIVKPAEYLINPQTMPSFDYHKSAEMQANWSAQHENNNNNEEALDDEQPAAVTDAHLPNPHMCPLIPIHGKTKDGLTEAENHKKISRRHVKIRWNFDRESWEMVVQGRNGAFCDGNFVFFKGVVPLYDRSEIQIAHVSLKFRLPTSQQQQLQQKQETEDSQEMDVDADEALPSVEGRTSDTPAERTKRESMSDTKPPTRINLKPPQRPDPPAEPLLGPDGLPIVKRRGPGRPPKDGIMSTRERKEREKAAKLAQAREANGGRTPPPSARGKITKPTPPTIEEPKLEIKPEKRKYTKRKLADGEGPGDDIDGDELDSDGERKAKKGRAQREKSESPEYPSRESLTAEQLARPPDSYANLLWKMLMEIYPKALPLKDIYRMMKMKWPWFVHEAQTEGWQSSVRHNLNSEFGKLFFKGDKEGKGFAWRANPDAQLSTDKKRTTQPAPQRPKPPQPRPPFQQGPGQPVPWQQGAAAFPTNGGQQQFINHGTWPQGQPNTNWPQDGSVPDASAQQNPQVTNGVNQAQRTPSQPPQSSVAPTQPGQAVNGPVPPAPQPPARPPPSVGTAASNMPCTIEGIIAIRRFEEEMYNQLDEKSKSREFWAPIFSSAKRRILHGAEESTLPDGETREERTIMMHMRKFVDLYKNVNFKGFSTRPSQPAEQVTGPVQSAVEGAESRTVSPANGGSGTDTALPSNGSATAEQTLSATGADVALQHSPSNQAGVDAQPTDTAAVSGNDVTPPAVHPPEESVAAEPSVRDTPN